MYEYQVISDVQPHEAERILNNYGEEGWELVSVVDYSTTNGMGIPLHFVHLFLKRHKDV